MRQILDAMNNAFSQLAGMDPIAKVFKDQFADLKGFQLPDSFEKAQPVPMHFYTRTVVAPFILTQQVDKAVVHTPTLSLENLDAYLANLDISREALSYTLANLGIVQLTVAGAGGAAGTAHTITADEAKTLQAQLDIQNNAYEAVGHEIANNQVLDNALYYFRSLTK